MIITFTCWSLTVIYWFPPVVGGPIMREDFITTTGLLR